MPSLAEVQKEFAESLRDPRRPVPRPVHRAGMRENSRRFDVYRNNVAMSLVDALRATFPAVLVLVGEEYFNAVARAYAAQHPPGSPVLLLYGHGFGDFLEGFPSSAGVPYLGDVARLEWARVNALHAADAGPADIRILAGIPEASLSSVTLTLHPSLSLMSSSWPVVSLWSASLDPGTGGEVDMKRAERAAVVRPGLRVCVHALEPGAHAFLAAVDRGAPLSAAADRAMEAEPAFDLAAQLRFVFDIGVVAAVNLPEQENHQ